MNVRQSFNKQLSGSPKGCETVAGVERAAARDTPGSGPKHNVALKGSQPADKNGTPSGCGSSTMASGGLRFASTPGYCLTTLRVVKYTLSPLVIHA